MKKFSVAVCTLLAATMVVSGCGKGETAGDATKGKDDSPKSEITLKYWAAPLASNERTVEVWSNVFKGFKDETGVSVEMEVVPWADTTKKVTTAITSGDGPDIIGCGNNMSVQLSPTGALLPLTKERMDKIGGADIFYENVTGEEGKDPVTISLNGGVHLFVYNVEAYKEVGMESIPEDWDTFIEAAQKVTKDTNGDGTPDVYGFGMFGKPTQSWKMFYNKFVQCGGELLDEEGIPGFKSEAGKEAFKFIGDLIGEYGIVPPAAAEWTQDDMVNAFINGQIFAGTIDNETIGTLQNSAMKDKFMVGELPYILPGKTEGIHCSGHTGGTNLGIFSKTEHEDECLDLLAYVSRPEISEEICNEFGVLSAVKAVYEGKELDPLTAAQIEVTNKAAVRMPLKPYFLPSINASSSTVQNVMFAAATGKMDDAFLNEELEKLDAEVRNNVKLSESK